MCAYGYTKKYVHRIRPYIWIYISYVRQTGYFYLVKLEQVTFSENHWIISLRPSNGLLLFNHSGRENNGIKKQSRPKWVSPPTPTQDHTRRHPCAKSAAKCAPSCRNIPLLNYILVIKFLFCQ